MKPNKTQPNPSKRKYCSDALVDLMKALGIEYVSLNPGASFRGLHDSIVNYGGNQNPELILCCHEEIAVDIASGYAKATGKPMAAIVHDIVGLLHASQAIFDASVDRVPVLVLGSTGPMAIERRRPWIDWIHTALVQGNVVRDYVKWDDQPTTLPSAIDSFLRGYQLATTNPKGPVYLCFDAGMLEDEVVMPVAIPDVSRYRSPAPIQGDPTALRKVAELLVEAERPVVIADYLGKEPPAVDALVELAELLSLPVVDNGNMFSFPNTHPLDLTGAEIELLSQADLVLSLNVFDLFKALSTVDASTRRTENIITPEATKIVDISLRHLSIRSWCHEYGKLQPTDLSISADTFLALSSLISLCRELLTQKPEKRAIYQERFTWLKAKHDELRRNWKDHTERVRNEKPISVPRLTTELWEVIKDEDWVLTNQGLTSWPRKLWDWSKPYQYIGSRMGGGLGFGIGISIGAALANRPLNRLCIDIQPDGDLLFTPSGLWTAAHHRIPLLVVMFNNRSYYNSERHQEMTAKTRERPVANKCVGTRIDDPPVDFASLARSFGLYGEGPIEAPNDLRPALERAVRYVKDRKQAALVDVHTQPR